MALKILLADDSMVAQNMGKKILTDAGYEVVVVSNGAAALKQVPEVKPDIMLVDVYMPGYTGLEVCQRVKSAPETANIPVLLTVGTLEPYRPEDGSKARADGVIVKPFEASDLISLVSRLAERILEARKAAAVAADEVVARDAEAFGRNAPSEETPLSSKYGAGIPTQYGPPSGEVLSTSATSQAAQGAPASQYQAEPSPEVASGQPQPSEAAVRHDEPRDLMLDDDENSPWDRPEENDEETSAKAPASAAADAEAGIEEGVAVVEHGGQDTAENAAEPAVVADVAPEVLSERSVVQTAGETAYGGEVVLADQREAAEPEAAQESEEATPEELETAQEQPERVEAEPERVEAEPERVEAEPERVEASEEQKPPAEQKQNGEDTETLVAQALATMSSGRAVEAAEAMEEPEEGAHWPKLETVTAEPRPQGERLAELESHLVDDSATGSETFVAKRLSGLESHGHTEAPKALVDAAKAVPAMVSAEAVSFQAQPTSGEAEEVFALVDKHQATGKGESAPAGAAEAAESTGAEIDGSMPPMFTLPNATPESASDEEEFPYRPGASRVWESLASSAAVTAEPAPAVEGHAPGRQVELNEPVEPTVTAEHAGQTDPAAKAEQAAPQWIVGAATAAVAAIGAAATAVWRSPSAEPAVVLGGGTVHSIDEVRGAAAKRTIEEEPAEDEQADPTVAEQAKRGMEEAAPVAVAERPLRAEPEERTEARKQLAEQSVSAEAEAAEAQPEAAAGNELPAATGSDETPVVAERDSGEAEEAGEPMAAAAVAGASRSEVVAREFPPPNGEAELTAQQLPVGAALLGGATATAAAALIAGFVARHDTAAPLLQASAAVAAAVAAAVPADLTEMSAPSGWDTMGHDVPSHLVGTEGDLDPKKMVMAEQIVDRVLERMRSQLLKEITDLLR